MVKLVLTGMFMKKHIFALRDLLYQQTLQPSNESEKELEESYEKAIRLSIENQNTFAPSSKFN